MYVVGLTGGIGSGKSAAAACFSALGVPVVDTDAIAHQLTQPGMPALDQIAQSLGNQYLTAGGALDRPLLRQRIFADAVARKLLERILHPLIRAAAIATLHENLNAPYQILVVPLLFESDNYQQLVNQSLVIDCSEAAQIRRTMERNLLSEAEVRAIMTVQLPRDDRLARADDVILNEGSLQELAEKVREKHEKYINTCVVS